MRRLSVPLSLLAAVALAWVMLPASPANVRAADANGSEYIEVFDPGWDSPTLTVALQASKAVDQIYRQAVFDAIAAWNAALTDVELVNVTGDRVAAAQADIRIILTRGFTGGVVFGGRALCSAPGCHQVLTSTTLNLHDYTLVYGTVLHELGQHLGSGTPSRSKPPSTSWGTAGS